MNRRPSNFRHTTDPTLSRDLIRRYLENETSETESHLVQRGLTDSADFRREFTRVENYLASLRALPKHNPPERVWAALQSRIEHETPTRIWFPWLYAHPAWGLAVRALPVLIIIATVLSMGNTYWANPNYYDVVVIDDVNGFGQEAESYVIYHDLAGESLPLRDSLIAYCIDSGS